MKKRVRMVVLLLVGFFGISASADDALVKARKAERDAWAAFEAAQKTHDAEIEQFGEICGAMAKVEIDLLVYDSRKVLAEYGLGIDAPMAKALARWVRKDLPKDRSKLERQREKVWQEIERSSKELPTANQKTFAAMVTHAKRLAVVCRLLGHDVQASALEKFVREQRVQK
jgi:hypothetical protein